MRGWLEALVEGIRRKLDEVRDILDTPIIPDDGMVPIPIRRPVAPPPPRRR